jgi:hypothetical protein
MDDIDDDRNVSAPSLLPKSTKSFLKASGAFDNFLVIVSS